MKAQWHPWEDVPGDVLAEIELVTLLLVVALEVGHGPFAEGQR